MTYRLQVRWRIPATVYELQEIQGSDESVWLRINQNDEFLAVFSAAKQGPGVMPKERVVAVLAEAATARRPPVIINALRFMGWEFWPAIPLPLKDYFQRGFGSDLSLVAAVCDFPGK